MHAVLLVYLLVNYITDRWHFLRICKSPVPYSASLVTSTLWWVQWVLLLKLILAFWAFGSLPGISLNDAILASIVNLNDATGLSVQLPPPNPEHEGGLVWISERLATVGSALIVVGFVLLVLTMIFTTLGTFLYTQLAEFFNYFCMSSKDESHLWPTTYPKFSHVLKGKGVSKRVRILTAADDAGRGETLVLETDIDPRRCANCLSPLGALLYLMGIKTYRRKLKSRDAFEALPQKTYQIIGGENMTYAPHFMPSYKEAFSHDPAAAAAMHQPEPPRAKDSVYEAGAFPPSPDSPSRHDVAAACSDHL